MRKILSLLQGVLFFCSFNLHAQVDHLVISQVYGGGGNSGAPYTNDFIELFNPTTSSVSLTGWSVQYAATTGTNWSKTDLNGTIAPGGYYLIQESGGLNGIALPTANATGTISMAAGAGKVALLNTGTVITAGTVCPSAGVVDIVGYGTGTTCFEGGPTATISNTTAALRKNNGCTDTNNNSSDFSTGTPNPRNSSSPINICNCTPPTNQPTSLNLIPAIQSIDGSFTAATGTIPADNYLVLLSTSNLLSQQPVPGTNYTVGNTLGNAQIVSVNSSTSFTATGLTASTSYYFFIYSYTTTNTCYNLISPLTGSTATNANPTPTISVIKGNDAAEPSTQGTFTIVLSAAAPAGGVIVSYTLGGTAGLNIDYTDGQAGSISITEGSISGTVTLNPIDDVIFEGTETITLSLIVPDGYILSGTGTATIDLLDNDPQPISNIVINQVYGGGGNSGALYKNDFIELYNNENAAVNLSGWSVQYSSATGTGTWSTTLLTGNIPAHGFFLVKEAAGTGGTTSLPAPDVTGTIAMGAGAGKVILSNSTTAQTGANPAGANVIDKVGYGSTANGFETAPAPAPDNTTSVQRIADGVDNNNNSTDFKVAAPLPRNSSYTTAAPLIISLSPPDNSINVPYNIVPVIVFDKPIQKGTGVISFFENGVVAISIDVTSPDVVISNNSTVTINTPLAAGKSYYVHMDAGIFKDVYGNNFVGINNNTTWAFTTYNSLVPVTIPVTFNFQNCTGSGLLPDGFTQYSATGTIVWDCTPFGRDPAAPAGTAQYPNAVQINGFSGGTNVPNIDWLISPSIDLTGTTFPLLSFWSRTAFNGLPLQLKISTDYVSGDPRLANWTDINGKFPAQTSNTWTISSDINLSAYKQSNVHFAYVYTSTDEDGARWTVDDISLINSPTPPPPSLTVGTTDIQYTYAASGTTADKTFTFIGNDLTGDVTLSSTGVFLLSKDGSSFSSSLLYTVAEANNLAKTVYVRFAPTQTNQNFAGNITIGTPGVTNIVVNLKGTSIDPETTLEVVNWNMEWFGSTTLGPTNDDLQEQNAETILQNISADVFGLVEVVDESRLARIVSHMPGYSYVICNYGSHVNPFESGAGPLSEAQKEAFVYKTSLFSNISTTPLVTNGVNTAADLSNPAYNYFSSGRYPFMMTADVTLNGITKTVRFVLLHAKANTSPTATSYARRKAGADTLHYTLNNLYPTDNIIVLGDFNDDLDQSITDGFTTTSYIAFTTDATNFFSPTLALSLAGKKSTVSYNDVIDHVMLSNEFQSNYMPATANILTDAASLVTNYGSTTTDHYPVFTRYMFCKLTCPENISVSNSAGQCGATVNFDVSSTMTCGTVTAEPASGSFFPIGTTTVHVTASSGETCSFTVTVTDSENPTINCPDNQTRNTNADQCNYTVIGTEFDATANDNCVGVTVTNNFNNSNTLAGAVFNKGETTVTWTDTDAVGNTATCSSIITVEDHQEPVITAPSNIAVNTDAGVCYATNVSLGTASTSDNCPGETVSNNAPVQFPRGITTVIWAVTDASGNTKTATQTVTVSDNQNPTIVAPTAVNVTPNNSSCTAKNVPLGNAVTDDNCSGTTVTNNAPAIFPLGNTIVTWKVTDASGNSATANQIVTVAVNPPITVSIPDVFAVSPGGEANTIYIGYGPTSLTLNGVVSGGAGSYSYKWTIGSSAGPALNTTSSYVVSPGSTATYYFNVKDMYGCSAPLVTKTVYVEDVRCGAKQDKIIVCQLVKGKYVTNCIASKDVASALANGSYLGACINTTITSTNNLAIPETSFVSLAITAMPNPSSQYFTIGIKGGNTLEKLKLRVTDILGRTMEQRENIQTNSTLTLGHNYRPGVYIVEIIQGAEHKLLKLIKAGN